MKKDGRKKHSEISFKGYDPLLELKAADTWNGASRFWDSIPLISGQTRGHGCFHHACLWHSQEHLDRVSDDGSLGLIQPGNFVCESLHLGEDLGSFAKSSTHSKGTRLRALFGTLLWMHFWKTFVLCWKHTTSKSALSLCMWNFALNFPDLKGHTDSGVDTLASCRV